MRWYLRVYKLVSPSVGRTITDQHNKQTTLPFPQSIKGYGYPAGIDVLKETCYSVARTKQGHAKVAQSVEHSTENAGVGGSIPPLGTFCFLAKV